MPTLYWSILILLLGGCIGSFLNVVIYRWPRGLSIRRPSRSFCPNCETTIGWYDNVPVISFLVLRGRCRKCGTRISAQYPLVELATALLFLMAYDMFFVARMRVGVGEAGNESILVDWPMLIAHWVLWSGMIVLAIMDLEAYMVDIKVTWVVSAVGLIGHMLWTPASSAGWIRPGPEGAVMAFGAAIGLLIGFLAFLRPLPVEQLEEEPPPAATPARGGRGWLLLLLPALLVLGYLLMMEFAPHRPVGVRLPRIIASEPLYAVWHWDFGLRAATLNSDTVRLLGGLAVLFLGLAAAASQPQPEADEGIAQEVMSEAPQSRGNALFELKLLSPAVILGLIGFLALHNHPEVYATAEKILHWTPAGEWQPIWGLSTGMAGWIIGGAVGWFCRIFFTLLFGKEALGMGDVHILAAAGAVAGWPVAFLGFFLAAPITLLALVLIFFRRRHRWVPYGPWLALAFLVAAVFQDRILQYLSVRWVLVTG